MQKRSFFFLIKLFIKKKKEIGKMRSVRLIVNIIVLRLQSVKVVMKTQRK